MKHNFLTLLSTLALLGDISAPISAQEPIDITPFLSQTVTKQYTEAFKFDKAVLSTAALNSPPLSRPKLRVDFQQKGRTVVQDNNGSYYLVPVSIRLYTEDKEKKSINNEFLVYINPNNMFREKAISKNDPSLVETWVWDNIPKTMSIGERLKVGHYTSTKSSSPINTYFYLDTTDQGYVFCEEEVGRITTVGYCRFFDQEKLLTHRDVYIKSTKEVFPDRDNP